MATIDDKGTVDPYRPPAQRGAGEDESNPAAFHWPRQNRAQSVVVSITLFLITAAACWAGGGPVFAMTIFLIASAHALGHFYIARRHGIECSGPYFVPHPAHLIGISGAFLQMRWPIKSRRALVQVFLAGPLAGLAASVLAIVVGLPLSEIADLDSGVYFEFGTSLLAWGLEWLLISEPANGDLLLSPIAFAGWIGIHLNSWQLLPVGRFDGGRILTAVIGYSRFLAVSGVLLVYMFVVSIYSGAAPYLALVGLATHWRLKEQIEGMEHEPLPRGQAVGALAVLGLLLLLTYPLFSPNFSFG